MMQSKNYLCLPAHPFLMESSHYFQYSLNAYYFRPLFMPPLKKGAYCFATVGRSVCRRSVGRSVDQVLYMSAQYLLTPSLDQYQTWYRGWPQWVDDPYWFSGHMIKGQGQTILLSPLCCLPYFFWPWCRGCPQCNLIKISCFDPLPLFKPFE